MRATLDGMTARRKADRAHLALMVTGLAFSHGLTAEYRAEEPGARRGWRAISAPHGLRLTVSFDGTAPDADTHVLSWHGVEDGWRLSPAVFPRVNEFHGRKATDVAHWPTELLDLLGRRFAAIEDGSAFLAGLPDESGALIDIDPARADQLAAEMGEDWLALLGHPVAGPFIKGFRIPKVDEEP